MSGLRHIYALIDCSFVPTRLVVHCAPCAVDDAIPPPLLARLQANHKQMVKRVRETTPPEEWSHESDKPGVVDKFRLYGLDPAYQELLTLPKVFPIVDRAIREGRGRKAHSGGPRLYHEMAQHMPAGTPGGQSWQCVFSHRVPHQVSMPRACFPPPARAALAAPATPRSSCPPRRALPGCVTS